MNKSKVLLSIYVFLLGFIQAQAQMYLSYQDFFERVLKYHPVIKQAGLLSEQARQELIMVRGTGFDPKLISTWQYKDFKDKNYYNIWQNYLKVPTWFGAEFKVGYEEIYGSNVNPELSIPVQGQSYVGISVPVGAGLFIDQRRATLRQAQLMRKMTEAERVKIINKLVFEAAKDYWEWYFRYNRYKNTEFGFNLAKQRYEFVKRRVSLGEEAPIDSTEALILFQNRYVNFNIAQIEWINATLTLSNHLWDENNNPLELDTLVKPLQIDLNVEKLLTPSKEELLSYAAQNHPEILKLQFKLKQLYIDKRMATENLKPQINLSYSLINTGFNPFANINSEYAAANYKAGFNIEIPILYRKELGKLQLTKAKINTTTLEQNYIARQISNQINATYNELLNLEEIYKLQKNLVNYSNILREGELQKFDNGESSLFLVNARESSLLEAQIKLIELESKYYKTRAGLYFAAGKID